MKCRCEASLEKIAQTQPVITPKYPIPKIPEFPTQYPLPHNPKIPEFPTQYPLPPKKEEICGGIK